MQVRLADLQLFEGSLQLLLLAFEADISCHPISLHSTADHGRVNLSGSEHASMIIMHSETHS